MTALVYERNDEKIVVMQPIEDAPGIGGYLA